MTTLPTRPSRNRPLDAASAWARALPWSRPTRQTLLQAWQEHGLALVLYGLLALVVTWPLVRDFSTLLMDEGGDARNNLWTFWHLAQWAQGNEPLLSTQLLFYPYGLSMLLHGVGPAIGALSLPFWPFGPEAAYNGALLVGLVLTGYSMYRLARGLGLDRAIALFAGVVLMTSAMPLGGVLGHPEKVFIAGIPLTALTLHHALDPKRSAWWGVATGLCLLLTILSSGYQFVYAAFLSAFFVLAIGLVTPADERARFLRRVLLVGVSAALLTGPVILLIERASDDPLLLIQRTEESTNNYNHPDVLQFLVPARYSFFGSAVNQRIAERFPQISPGLETSVTLPWIGIFLCLFAALGKRGAGRRWFIFFLICVLFALGPKLKLLGATEWGESHFSIPLPYRLLTELPGISFMRVPGRWMKVVYVAFAVTVSFGLLRLVRRFPKHRHALILGATALILLHNWPAPWPQRDLPTPPAFYQQLAHDAEEYGVFDVPIKSKDGMWYEWNFLETSLLYQTYQMTHHKPIAGGFLSRVFHSYPIPFSFMRGISGYPPDIFVNGSRANQYRTAQTELAVRNYRYVVWHKELFPDAPGQATAQQFIQATFEGQRPLLEDERTAVYRVATSPPDVLTPTLIFGENWHLAPLPRRVISPATVYVETPRAQRALLRLQPGFMHDPASPAAPGLGTTGRLTVQVGETLSVTAELVANRVAALPLDLPAGRHPMTLTLEAGNFAPADSGAQDATRWSVEVAWMELQTLEAGNFPQGTLVNGAPQRHDAPLKLFLGAGWYLYEPEMGSRWSSSPGELLIFSDAARQATLEWVPTLLHVPDADNGFGSEGQMQVTVNGSVPQPLSVQLSEVASVPLALDAGWNRVVLEMEAGDLQQSQRQEGADPRFLSFALSNINLVASDP